MADQKLLSILKQSVEVWDKWNEENRFICADLSGADLSGAILVDACLSWANLSGADLSGAFLIRALLNNTDLCWANLSGADLSGAVFLGANLSDANLSDADLSGACLRRAYLIRADLRDADLSGADLRDADLSGADLRGADLSDARLIGANLSGADLTGGDLTKASLVETVLENTNLTNCNIYGISAWGLKINERTIQTNLIITKHDEPAITVDNLQIAQFIYLLLNNENIRHIIDTITSKVVLILGRFAKEPKAVLDALRDKLREMDLTPILFDSDPPASKDTTGTVETLARMARFIIADITDPSSVPHELASIIPHLRTTPVCLIRLKGSSGYGMVEDFEWSYPWVLKTYEYTDGPALIAELPHVIGPANELAEEFRLKLEARRIPKNLALQVRAT